MTHPSKRPTHRIKECGPERLRGKEFFYQFDVKEDLFQLADEGNMAAYNALMLDYPARSDLLFTYGKIDNFGYIVAKQDLEVIIYD